MVTTFLLMAARKRLSHIAISACERLGWTESISTSYTTWIPLYHWPIAWLRSSNFASRARSPL